MSIPAIPSGFPTELPEPDAEARAHSARLVDRIREKINAGGGSITFARYMELALYAPGLGYYSAGTAKLGREGDFITAPEISPLFARCLARQCQQVLLELGGGDVLELGAGSGRLAVDLMLELERLRALPGTYLILEVSADLRARQREHIEATAPRFLPQVHWLEQLPERPLHGLILANEVVDALPVNRFRIEADQIQELRVGWREDGFRWDESNPAPPELARAVRHVRSTLDSALPPPYVSEINLGLGAWLASLAEVLERGVFLCIDYGYPRREYYHPQRSEGTLMCHYHHRAHPDPLIFPGLQDITAFVDFTALAEAGESCGMELAGFTSQAQFLFACGLDRLLTELAYGNPNRYLECARQAKLLTLPGEMGERFKVMALAKDWQTPLLGFSGFDYRGRL